MRRAWYSRATSRASLLKPGETVDASLGPSVAPPGRAASLVPSGVKAPSNSNTTNVRLTFVPPGSDRGAHGTGTADMPPVSAGRRAWSAPAYLEIAPG